MSKPTDEFLSPPSVVALAKDVLGASIDFDPYCSPGQLVKCKDGLMLTSDPEPWPTSGKWYVNPPFSESKHALAKLAQHFTRNPTITALVLCLAAPGSVYWREWVWSSFGPRRVAWIPRLSFYQLDAAGVAQPTKHNIQRELAFMLWTSDDRIVARFEKVVPAFASPAVHVQAGGKK